MCVCACVCFFLVFCSVLFAKCSSHNYKASKWRIYVRLWLWRVIWVVWLRIEFKHEFGLKLKHKLRIWWIHVWFKLRVK